MKSYTDLEQSKKLAEFLPLESSDGFWEYHDKWYSEGDEWEGYEDYPRAEPYLEYTRMENEWKEDKSDVPCWSLAALLSVLPKKYYPIKDHETNLILGKPKDKWCVLYWDATGMQDGEQTLEDNPIDACVEMILKLHELKAL